MKYIVFVDDNYHYMEKSERCKLGEFNTFDAAIKAAKKIVDTYLLDAHQPGMTAQALFESYKTFGEDPYIIAVPAQEDGGTFSAWDYAKSRCDELCASR